MINKYKKQKETLQRITFIPPSKNPFVLWRNHLWSSKGASTSMTQTINLPLEVPWTKSYLTPSIWRWIKIDVRKLWRWPPYYYPLMWSKINLGFHEHWVGHQVHGELVICTSYLGTYFYTKEMYLALRLYTTIGI